MGHYKKYAAVNQCLRQGETLFIAGSNQGCRISRRQTDGSRLVHLPRIGIYTGAGTSHSWLWFVEIFDRMGFHDLVFLDAVAIQEDGLGTIDVLVVSGGDTVAVAKALGPSGAHRLRDFIAGGGLYVGACAGAYLVMNSSKPHLNHFNFTGVKITNLSKFLPACRHLPHKFAQTYGCDYIFHPVRDTVQLKTTAHLPFAPERTLDAPLYGGPGMLAPDDSQVLAWYHDFTPKTVFLVDRELARTTLTGRAAALRAPLGKGRLYLCGPHFEHPRFPVANALIADAIYWDNQHPVEGQRFAVPVPLSSEGDSHRLLHDIKRQTSNARLSANSLEMQPMRWLIGAKYYEPEKIRVFLEAIWRRLAPLETRGPLRATTEHAQRLLRFAEATTAQVRQLKQQAEQGGETTDLAQTVFGLLQRYAISFLELYFQTICEPIPSSRS